jgi:Alpha/beta hydrolase domain
MILTSGKRLALGAFCSVLLLTHASSLFADVSRIEIDRRETLSSEQTSVRYEAFYGTLYFTLDPAAPGNQRVHDIDLAPVNADGLVEFSTDFKLLVPDRAIASDALLYHVNNRGGSRLPPEISLTHPLTGLGYTYLVTGWINELTPGENRYRLHAPIVGTATEPVTGQVRYEIIVGSISNDESINGEGHLAYTPTAGGLRNATLTARLNQSDPRLPVHREDFRLDVSSVEGANQPMVTLNLKGGLQPGMIYELIYEAQDPVLGGAGMAGIRDMVSLLRYGTDDNGLTTQIGALGLPALEHSVTWGNSQSGRLLRLFLYEGFNADLDGRQVFDGVMPVIAGAGYGMFNNRFAMPTRTNGQHENLLYPNDYFPFTYGDSTDPFTGRTDSVLARARMTDTVPKVMHIQTSNEYWIRGGSLPHTDPLGKQDAVIPAYVRFYAIGGSQHGSGSGRPSAPSGGQLPNNPNMWNPFADSLLVALVN